MDSQNLINVDDLMRQRLGGGEERELPGAWPRMLDLLEKEEKRRPIGFLFWRRGLSYTGGLLLIAALTVGGYHYSSELNGFRGIGSPMVGAHSAPTANSNSGKGSNAVSSAVLASNAIGNSKSVTPSATLNRADGSGIASVPANQNESNSTPTSSSTNQTKTTYNNSNPSTAEIKGHRPVSGKNTHPTQSHPGVALQTISAIAGHSNATVRHGNIAAVAATIDNSNDVSAPNDAKPTAGAPGNGSTTYYNKNGVEVTIAGQHRKNSNRNTEESELTGNNDDKTPVDMQALALNSNANHQSAIGNPKNIKLAVAAKATNNKVEQQHQDVANNNLHSASTSAANSNASVSEASASAKRLRHLKAAKRSGLAASKGVGNSGSLAHVSAANDEQTNTSQSTSDKEASTATTLASKAANSAIGANEAKRSNSKQHLSPVGTQTAHSRSINGLATHVTAPNGVNKHQATAPNGFAAIGQDVSVAAKRNKHNTPVASTAKASKVNANTADQDENTTTVQDDENPLLNRSLVFNNAAPSKPATKYKKISTYSVHAKARVNSNGETSYERDTMNITIDSLKLASASDEHNDVTGLNKVAKATESLRNLSAASHNTNGSAVARMKAKAGAGSKNASVSKGKANKAGKQSTVADNRDEDAREASRFTSMLKLPAIRRAVIVPQGAAPLVNLPALAHTEAHKKKANHFWENLSNSFNDMRNNLAGTQFSPGITTGINATFFGPNSFKGFQFGFAGAFVVDDRWSFFGELKYFHRTNSNYSMTDNYINYSTNDSIVNSFNFSTLHSFEMPWSIRYTLKNFTFFAGANFLYTMAVNTGAAPSPYHSVVPYAAGMQSAPSLQEADFKGRFGMGYLMGFSVRVSPAVSLDFRSVQTAWDNAQSTGGKKVSDQLYKSPSLQFSMHYRFGARKSDD